jgi:hypothetical protein
MAGRVIRLWPCRISSLSAGEIEVLPIQSNIDWIHQYYGNRLAWPFIVCLLRSMLFSRV